MNASSPMRIQCVRLVSYTEKNMKTRSHAIDVIAALACLGGSWSCGGRDSSSDRTGQVGSAQIHAGVPAAPADYQSGRKTRKAQKEECSPIGVKRKDSFLHVKSTLPGSSGKPAKLDIHRVSPVYEDGWCDSGKGGAAHAVILVHGARTEGVASFDLQYPKVPQALHDEGGEERASDSERSEYSLMESLARAGIEAFAVNLLGYGLSSRFELDDPCSTNQTDQRRLLVSATGQPLFEVCSLPPVAGHFTNTAAAIQQLGAVVDHVLEKVDVEKVSLFAWSRGGNVTGVYTSLDPSKVESLVLLASEFDFKGNPQPYALIVDDRTQSFKSWDNQYPRECLGERDPAILDAIWSAGRMRDPLSSEWGPPDERTGGVRRAPTWDRAGWDIATAKNVQVPTLIMSGERDDSNPLAIQERIYGNLGTSSKVLIKIECASHQALWEGSTSPRWKGPHATVHDAAAQWIRFQTFDGQVNGRFTVDAKGDLHYSK